MTNYEIDNAFSVFRHILKKQDAYNKQYYYGGLMVSVLASSVVDRGFE